MIFRDRDKLAPGETALAEVRFAEDMVGVFGDHCVLRAYSPLRTVAGGILISPLPPELRRKDPELADKLRLLEQLPNLHERACDGKAAKAEDRAAPARAVLLLRGRDGADEAGSRFLTGRTASAWNRPESAFHKGEALCWDKESRQWISRTAFADLLAACLARAEELHRKDPLKPAFSRNALLSGWSKRLPQRLIQKILDAALKQGRLVVDGEGLRLAGHKVTLAADQAGLRQKLLQAHQRAGLTPPNAKDVLEELGVSAKEAAPCCACSARKARWSRSGTVSITTGPRWPTFWNGCANGSPTMRIWTWAP